MRVDHVQFSTDCTHDLQDKTGVDPILNHLKETILHGWPEDIKELPEDIRAFLCFRDQLSLDNVLKGQHIVLSRSAQPNILQQLHTAHLGQEKTKLLAREVVYWVNINKDIDRLVQTCVICQYYQPSQTAEPLMPHNIPTKPWSMLSTDLFEFDGTN